MKNYLQYANTIKNSTLCRYDALHAFSTDFGDSGDVDGWDFYSDIYMYGAWNGVLLGTTHERSCYIGRTNVFIPIEAEDYFIINIMMKLTINHETRVPTQGKVMWRLLNDPLWDEDKEIYFDLIPDDKWHLYSINVGPKQYWQGYVNDLRVYPFIDASPKDQFAIQYIRISSYDKYRCLNTNCSYYPSYEHPCPGAGARASVIAGEAKERYTTVSGISDTLLVNIDDYGEEVLRLGTHNNIKGREMARIIAESMSRINIGGYTYASVEHNFYEKLQITSGNVGESTATSIDYSYNIFLITAESLIEDLSFFTDLGLIFVQLDSGKYMVKGDTFTLMRNLFFIPSSTNITNSLETRLEDLNIFSGVTEVRALRPTRVVSMYMYSGGNEWDSGRYVDIKSDTAMSFGLIGNMYQRIAGGNYFPPNELYDVDNDLYALNNQGPALAWGAVYTHQGHGGGASTHIRAIAYFSIQASLFYSDDEVAQEITVTKGTTTYTPVEISNQFIEVVLAEDLDELTALGYTEGQAEIIDQGVAITGGTAASALGFYNDSNINISTNISGKDAATEFDYASSRQLRAFEIFKLVTNNTNNIVYKHSPFAYQVEGGRSDFYDSSTANSVARSFSEIETYNTFPNAGKTLIDVSHPLNDSGRIKEIYVDAKIEEADNAKVYIVRPFKDGTFKVIHSKPFPIENSSFKYTTRHVTYKIDCNLLVNKGDCIAVYNASVTAPIEHYTKRANATYFQFSGPPPTSGRFDPGNATSHGLAGFCLYAKSIRTQKNIILDIDIGERINADRLVIKGTEENDYFEYNIARCLDLSFDVNLHGENHRHRISNYYSGSVRTEWHDNIAHGIECLNDGIKTPDNGLTGTGWGNSGGNGLWTSGIHSYFYVNGDAEWLHNGANYYWQVTDSKYEYSWSDTSATIDNYASDPVSILLNFPHNTQASIHKTIMYFKEARNFRSFSLSYKLPENRIYESNELIYGYKKLSGYNSIVLDGITYLPTIGDTFYGVAKSLYDNTINIMFNNPTRRSVPIFSNGTMTNWVDVQMDYRLDWNIIEHNFDDVIAEGFNITAYYHESTKINEIEIYSKFPIEPTLIDNAYLIHSTYGDHWDEAFFYDSDNEEISADVLSAPRYMQLELFSQSEFYVRGIELKISEEDVKLEDCKGEVLLEHSKTGVQSEVNTIEIENVYDKEFTLLVDLPKTTNSNRQIVSWLRMGSQYEVDYPEVGPGAILHKNADYPLLNKHSLCSINADCYGLVNLIDGQPIYMQRGIDGDDWVYLGEGQHGQSINTGINYYSHESLFTVTGTLSSISSQYLKIAPVSGDVFIQSIYVFNSDERQPISSVYYNSSVDSSAQLYEAEHSNGYDVRYNILKNGSGDNVSIDWTEATDSLLYIQGGLVTMNDHENTSSASIESNTITALDDFEFEMPFYMIARYDYITAGQPYRASGALEFIFTDYYDNEIIKVKVFDEDNTSAEGSSPRLWLSAEDKEAIVELDAFPQNNSAYFSSVAGSYLMTPDHDDFSVFSGDDDFTIDFWFKREARFSSYNYICGNSNTGEAASTITFLSLFNSSNIFSFGFYYGGGSYVYADSTTVFDSSSLGVWHHAAFVNDNGMGRLFIDGKQEDTCTLSGITLNNSINNFAIGQHGEYTGNLFQGWLGEFRISKGIARWTSNFTPPMTEYTTDSGTVCLVHFTEDGWETETPSAFIDSGTTGHTFTNPQNVVVHYPYEYQTNSFEGKETAVLHNINISRAFNNLTINLDGVEYNTLINLYKIAQIKVNFLNYDVDVGCFEYNLLGIPRFTSTNAIGLKLLSADGYDRMNRLLLRYYKPYSALSSDINIYSSYSNSGYTLLENATAHTGTDNQYYREYVAIDLGKRHSLSIVRNYGTKDNLLPLSNDSYIEYSNNDTSNIDDIVWKKVAPQLVLTFEDGLTDIMNEDRVIVLNGTTNFSTTTKVFGEKSIEYFNSTDDIFWIDWDDNPDIGVDFIDDDFTIHFWENLKSYQHESITDSSRWGAPSFIYGHQHVGYYGIYANWYYIYADGGNGGLQTQVRRSGDRLIMGTIFMGKPDLGVWTHYAFTKKDNYFYGFTNGKLMGSIELTGPIYQYPDVNYERWAFGYAQNNYLSATYNVLCNSYQDEFIIIKGSCLWTDDFVIPSNTYAPLTEASKEDARWIRLIQQTGGGAHLDKIGVYPDISQVYSPGGGYNQEWYSLGNKLTDYSAISINVAEGASVSGSSSVELDLGDYSAYWGAYRAVDGDIVSNGFDKCWGYTSDDPLPTLEIAFDDVYNINTIVIYHAPGNTNDFMNEDFEVYYKNTVSGTYTSLFSVAGNASRVTTHTFDVVEAQYIKLEISSYTAPDDIAVYSSDAEISHLVDGGFVKQIQVFTLAGGGEITSEDWPIVVIDLKDTFDVKNHKLYNNNWVQGNGAYSQSYMTQNWDNSEDFFRYSNSLKSDPKLIAFNSLDADGQLVYFASSESYTAPTGLDPGYRFGTSVYLDYGLYDVTWRAYNASVEDLISLRITNGSNVIDLFATTIADNNWADQTSDLFIPEAGNYTIESIIDDESYDTWGAGLPVIKRITNHNIRWISLTRDTATGYAWTNATDDKGIDYLDKVEIYSNEAFRNTEYYWWWHSTLSTLENDALLTKVGRRSLRINYPASTEYDNVEIIEGSSFGRDDNWSEMDLLSFWLYVSDITKMDTDWGGVAFGSFYGSTHSGPKTYSPWTYSWSSGETEMGPGYYVWDFRNMNLKTGWNRIRLRFDSFDSLNVVPSTSGYLSEILNFRNREISSFGFVYRGLGEAFHLCLDDLRIERNYFYDDVKFGKGLCLTVNEFADIPIADISPKKGSIEMWIKPYYDSVGKDIFADTRSRQLFSIVNNDNDVISLGIRSASWFEIGVGGAKTNYKSVILPSILIPIEYRIQYKEPFHVALVWSHDGKDTDNGETVRFYINGEIVLGSTTTWEVDNDKSVALRLGGGASVLAYNNDIDGAGVFDNVKVYNYCKDSFTPNKEEDSTNNYLSPNHFLKISADGINFYGLDDGSLPLEFTLVPPGEKRTVYLKALKDDRFKNVGKTGEIELDWITTV